MVMSGLTVNSTHPPEMITKFVKCSFNNNNKITNHMITFRSNIWEKVSQTVGQTLRLVCYFVSSDIIITDC